MPATAIAQLARMARSSSSRRAVKEEDQFSPDWVNGNEEKQDDSVIIRFNKFSFVVLPLLLLLVSLFSVIASS